MSDPYLIAKWLHILSSTILFGTGFGTALHMLLAYRSRNVAAIAVVARNVVKADWLCTLPSGIFQPLSGVYLVYKGGWNPGALWLDITYALFAITGLYWVIVVGLQIKISTIASASAAKSVELLAEYYKLFRLWFALGWPAFLALVIVYAMMVMKPG